MLDRADSCLVVNGRWLNGPLPITSSSKPSNMIDVIFAIDHVEKKLYMELFILEMSYYNLCYIYYYYCKLILKITGFVSAYADIVRREKSTKM